MKLELLDPLKPIPSHRAPIVWRKNYIHRGKSIKRIKTICEVLRKLYRSAIERDDKVAMQDIGEAFDMAKRMQYKLKEYAGKSNDPVYLIADDKEGHLWLTKGDFMRRDRAGDKGK